MYTNQEQWTILSSILRYLFRFIELPFLFTVFFIVLFILSTVLHSPALQERALSAFLWPLFAVFHYPDTYQTTSFQPVLVLSAFWLLVLHLILEIYSFVAKKRGGSTGLPERKIVHRGLWVALALALISLVFANNVTDKPAMAVILVFVVVMGQVSYWLSGKVLAASQGQISS